MAVDSIQNVLIYYALKPESFMALKNDHIYLEWNKGDLILFSYFELRKLQKQFSYPSFDNLYNLLKLRRPWDIDTSTKNYLQIFHICA